MAEMQCPVCGRLREIRKERVSEWILRWDESQWSSPEWRRFIAGLIRDSDIAQEKLSELEPLCEKQEKYIDYLEKHLELLQKTLELAEKFTPRPIILHKDGEVIT